MPELVGCPRQLPGPRPPAPTEDHQEEFRLVEHLPSALNDTMHEEEPEVERREPGEHHEDHEDHGSKKEGGMRGG